jgi:hypothetical protein
MRSIQWVIGQPGEPMLPLAIRENPVRLAFVGQREYFAVATPPDATPGLTPSFVDYRAGEDFAEARAALEALAPDCIVVFRPELIPRGGLDGLDAITVGYMTEPLPRPGAEPHPDLTGRLAVASTLDAGAFDRIISFDPLIAPTIATFAPVWRSLPLPVADRFYRDVTEVTGPPRSLFVGRSTPHRESFLVPIKHRFDTMHLAHGASDDRLAELLAEFEIAINLHNEPYPTFENRVSLHLAAGALCISEPVSPTHGLEPGIDFVEVTQPWELEEVMAAATTAFDDYRPIRLRGRIKAETFRASAVWPRVIADLAADVQAHGRGRR